MNSETSVSDRLAHAPGTQRWHAHTHVQTQAKSTVEEELSMRVAVSSIGRSNFTIATNLLETVQDNIRVIYRY